VKQKQTVNFDENAYTDKCENTSNATQSAIPRIKVKGIVLAGESLSNWLISMDIMLTVFHPSGAIWRPTSLAHSSDDAFGPAGLFDFQ